MAVRATRERGEEIKGVEVAMWGKGEVAKCKPGGRHSGVFWLSARAYRFYNQARSVCNKGSKSMTGVRQVQGDQRRGFWGGGGRKGGGKVGEEWQYQERECKPKLPDNSQ